MTIENLQVMLVEDHAFQRRLGLRLLADLGLDKVEEAADGFLALDLLRNNESKPDVILVDLDLPGMDGIEFIGVVAQERLGKSIAIVSAMEPALLHTVQVMAKASGLRVLGAVEKPLTAIKLTHILSLYTRQDAEQTTATLFPLSLDQIRSALQDGDIYPVFQPQVELANGKVIGVEALARWRTKEGQTIFPSQFIPMMETGGLIEELTNLMLLKSCEWHQRWKLDGHHLRVSVNVSAHNLTGPEVADRYEKILQAHGMSPNDMIIEITESSVMSDTARGLGMLARLRLKGFGLSVDDFGTGYSSLSQLSQIPFSELKIDHGFVNDSPNQSRKKAVIEASIDLAKKLDLTVVAEGVETMEEWQVLAQLGCHYAQGYLISRPVPGEQLLDAIATWRKSQH
jgi:EAL domain-containing protein (putative c-di-GMP-specific phosphodiesterase class I)/AmiR/NasT family two-component response regulator